jgi:hypothetical protein
VTASTTLELTVGGSVCDVRESVHFATAPAAPHVTVALAAGLAPAALRATTEYVTGPTAEDVTVHVDVALEHPVQVNTKGDPLQVAVSVSALPTVGVLSDAVTTHAGSGPGPVEPPVGEHIATGIEPPP